MIERWSIKKCHYIITELLGISAKGIADRLYVKRQTILNWENGTVTTNVENHEIQYTLALKDILEERGVISIEELVSQKISELESL